MIYEEYIQNLYNQVHLNNYFDPSSPMNKRNKVSSNQWFPPSFSSKSQYTQLLSVNLLVRD